MISTRDLSKMGDIECTRRRMRALATLDAVLSREWEPRHGSFNARWGESVMIASMRTGSGDYEADAVQRTLRARGSSAGR